MQKHLAKWKKREYHYWKLLDAQATQDIVDRIDRGFRLFFNTLKRRKSWEGKGRQVSRLSFKKIKKYKSITFKQTGYKLFSGNIIRIGKKKFRYHKSQEIEGRVKTLTVKRDALDDFYIYAVTDHVATSEIGSNDRIAVGADFGLKTFLTLSDGRKIEYPEFLKKSIRGLKKASEQLSSKKKGSKNREKARKNFVRVHQKIVNWREDWFKKLANELCDQYGRIVFEDLNIQARQRLWGRKVSDYGFYSFLKILESIGRKRGTAIPYIDRFYPSSKTCSNCGYVKNDLNLRDRECVRPECNTIHDRDFNASVNILNKGIAD